VISVGRRLIANSRGFPPLSRQFRIIIII
jgi:hypothetical protein